MAIEALTYLSGFGNTFETEALSGALPIGRNSPQKPKYGLYAEQLSGTPFTAPQHSNQRSWLYRIRPGVRHFGAFRKLDAGMLRSAPDSENSELSPGPLRWSPPSFPEGKPTFVSGLRTVTTAGDAESQNGMAVHLFFISESMTREHFVNADGELLIVPQAGSLRFRTEFGVIEIEPGEICVIPRGVTFRVELINNPARGYICENYGGAFALPNRGPIGANCLANARDFKAPVASYEEIDQPYTLVMKWGGGLHSCEVPYSPIDVVAWHGNYYPYKYDLRLFSPVGALLFDHPDPSIFTVLTSQSETPGTANVDFIIFPDRWSVAEDTFRPPWFHRNSMSEFMGLIYGVYDAKPNGFTPGGFSLHNTMLPHGPDADAFKKASSNELKPVKIANSLAFMFETRFRQRVTTYASSLPELQHDYSGCWNGLEKHFNSGSALKK